MKRSGTIEDHYEPDVMRAADRVSSAAIRDYLSAAGTESAVVVSAPAGAGKTGFIIKAVSAARRKGLRVAVATPTNQQAFELVGRLAKQHPGETITFVPASDKTLPEAVAQLNNVESVKARETSRAALLVGTLSKFGDALGRGDLNPVNTLLIDEAYQADSSNYYAMAGLAPTHLLVGDSGQLSPFSTIKDQDRWRGLPEDPLQTAVGVLRRNHPSTPVHKLPLSRRLDHRAVPVARSFYPDLPFSAALLPSTRALRLAPGSASDRRERLLDKALDHAADTGWAHIELPDAPVLTADPEILGLIGNLVERIRRRNARVRCERQQGWKELSPSRIAIGVSHNDQKDLLRAHLDSASYEDIVVDTANKLQGLEFDLLIAWHPLAGLPEVDPSISIRAGCVCF
jgi:hypothetical protein